MWGGQPGHKHRWRDVGERHRGGPAIVTAFSAGRDHSARGKSADLDLGDDCACGAWRGNYGAEPLHDCAAWARREPPCPRCYVCHTRVIFGGVRRVLRNDGTCWLNLGDGYAGSGGQGDQRAMGVRASKGGVGRKPARGGLKNKDLMAIPWRVGLALQADGWYLRLDGIWNKTNGMTDAPRDRPTHNHEYVLLLSKRPTYYYDRDAVLEPLNLKRWGVKAAPRTTPPPGMVRPLDDYQGAPQQPTAKALKRQLATKLKARGGRSLRSVWAFSTAGTQVAHYAPFPEALPERCIRLGCPPGGVVLDPFAGTGSTLIVARRLGRPSIGIELSEEYHRIAIRRLHLDTKPLF